MKRSSKETATAVEATISRINKYQKEYLAAHKDDTTKTMPQPMLQKLIIESCEIHKVKVSFIRKIGGWKEKC